MGARHQIHGLFVFSKVRKVQARTESPALAKDHHSAHIGLCFERIDRLTDRLKHRGIQCIHLVCARERDLRNVR